MSLTRKTEKKQSNPASKFIEAKCADDQGFFHYYKRDESDKNKGVNVKIDFSGKGFFILDCELASIRGWNDKKKFQIMSNEIRTSDFDWSQNGQITVTKKSKGTKREVIAKGSYAQVKDKVCNDEVCGKFHRCIYGMSEDGEMIQLALAGVAFASFKQNIEDNPAEIHQRWVRVKEWKEGTRGKVKYLQPIFEYGDEITGEEMTKASELDTKLQSYLDEYMKKAGSHLEHDDEDSPSFDPKNWREFKEGNQPELGSLPMSEIQSIRLNMEERGDVDSIAYECVSQAVKEFEDIMIDESWKERKNAEGKSLADLSLQELKEALVRIVSVKPNHKVKIFVEAAIEAKSAEAGPSDFEDFDDGDSIPF